MNGADTREGHIFTTEDEALKEIVERAEKHHNQRFQPKIEIIYERLARRAEGDTGDTGSLHTLEDEVDATGEQMLQLLRGRARLVRVLPL